MVVSHVALYLYLVLAGMSLCLVEGLLCDHSLKFGETYIFQVNVSSPRSICYDLCSSKEKEALQVYAECNETRVQHPVLVTVKQPRGVTSWSIPFIESGYAYSSVHRMLCPLLNVDNVPGESSLLIDMSTSSTTPVNLILRVSIVRPYKMRLNKPEVLVASPSSPSYMLFEYPPDLTRVKVRLTSTEDTRHICAIASIQSVYCPAVELLDDPDDRGKYQTMKSIAAFNVAKSNSRFTFYIVLSVFPNNGRLDNCDYTESESGHTISLDTVCNYSPQFQNSSLRMKHVNITIQPALSDFGYLAAIGVTVVFLITFYIVSCAWITVFDWWRYDLEAQPMCKALREQVARVLEEGTDIEGSKQSGSPRLVKDFAGSGSDDANKRNVRSTAMSVLAAVRWKKLARKASALPITPTRKFKHTMSQRSLPSSPLHTTPLSPTRKRAKYQRSESLYFPPSIPQCTTPRAFTSPQDSGVRRRGVTGVPTSADSTRAIHPQSRNTMPYAHEVTSSTSSPLTTSTPSPLTTSTSSPLTNSTPSPLTSSTRSPLRTSTPSPLTSSTPSPLRTSTSSPLTSSILAQRVTSIDDSQSAIPETGTEESVSNGGVTRVEGVSDEGVTHGEGDSGDGVTHVEGDSGDGVTRVEGDSHEDVSDEENKDEDQYEESVPALESSSSDKMEHQSDTPHFPVRVLMSELGELDEQQRAFDYYSIYLLLAMVFYALPAYQLMTTYAGLTATGNEDLCYYNYLCSHPLEIWGVTVYAFNNLFSNIGYFTLGILLILITYRRRQLYQCYVEMNLRRPCHRRIGIPQQFGIYYAMGISMMGQGLMSLAYHMCPTSSNFKLDTSFMYVQTGLAIHKVLQSRCPDKSADPRTFMQLLAALLVAVAVGDTINNYGNLIFWLLFFISYVVITLLFVVDLYYRWQITSIDSVKRLISCYLSEGIFPPGHKPKFVLSVVSFSINFAIAVAGLIFRPSTLESYILGILIANYILYLTYYVITKAVFREIDFKKPSKGLFFAVLTLFCSLIALPFYTSFTTDWAVSPAVSRDINKDCVFLGFYCSHDMWHFFSGFGLFFGFMFFMTVDDLQEVSTRNNLMTF